MHLSQLIHNQFINCTPQSLLSTFFPYLPIKNSCQPIEYILFPPSMIPQTKLVRNHPNPTPLQGDQPQGQGFEELFPTAESEGAFAEWKLREPNRRMKLLEGAYVHERIFYFQLLRLIHQTDAAYHQPYLNKIYQLLDCPPFQQLPPSHHTCNTHHPQLPQRAFSTLRQLLQQLAQRSIAVQDILNKYPLIDTLMVLLLRTILVSAGKCNPPNPPEAADIYECLADYFEIEIRYLSNCLQFTQTNIFVYPCAQNQLYLAYTTPTTTQHLHIHPHAFSPSHDTSNISSVSHRVSQIDIPLDQDSLSLSKLNQTQFVDYDYSQSQLRHHSKSIQDNSQFLLSRLMNDESLLQSSNAIKTNKILEKEVVGQKKGEGCGKGGKDMDWFEIKEVGLESQNGSAAATPKTSRFVSFVQDIPPKGQICTIYQKGNNPSGHWHSANQQYDLDSIKEEQDMLSTGQSESFRAATPTYQLTCPQVQQLSHLISQPDQECSYQPPLKPIQSIYEMRSIKSIVSCNDSQSYLLDTPLKTSFSPSRKQTAKDSVAAKQNQYTRHGYINNNITVEFTSSVILRELKDPFKSKIQSIKTRARNQRSNIQNLMCF